VGCDRFDSLLANVADVGQDGEELVALHAGNTGHLQSLAFALDRGADHAADYFPLRIDATWYQWNGTTLDAVTH
jgi:hypothetical protein